MKLSAVLHDGYFRLIQKATHAGMRTYFFAAESKEVMIKWINLMTLASLMMGRIG